MGRHPTARRVKIHRIYTVWEAAETLGCHRQTVIRWIKDKGLPADTNSRPWLIKGSDLRTFLGLRRAARRCRLAIHQLFCLGCKGAREPAGKIADYHHDTPKTGMLKALCPECFCVMNKKIRRRDLEQIRARIDITVQKAVPRLMSRADPPETVTINEEQEAHGKAG